MMSNQVTLVIIKDLRFSQRQNEETSQNIEPDFYIILDKQRSRETDIEIHKELVVGTSALE